MKHLIDHYFVTCGGLPCGYRGTLTIGAFLVPLGEGPDPVVKYTIRNDMARRHARTIARASAVKDIQHSLKLAAEFTGDNLLKDQPDVKALLAANSSGYYAVVAVRNGKSGKPQPVLGHSNGTSS
jgi:hypothetical protein